MNFKEVYQNIANFFTAKHGEGNNSVEVNEENGDVTLSQERLTELDAELANLQGQVKASTEEKDKLTKKLAALEEKITATDEAAAETKAAIEQATTTLNESGELKDIDTDSPAAVITALSQKVAEYGAQPGATATKAKAEQDQDVSADLPSIKKFEDIIDNL